MVKGRDLSTPGLYYTPKVISYLYTKSYLYTNKKMGNYTTN